MNEIILLNTFYLRSWMCWQQNHTTIINGNQIDQPMEVWIWSHTQKWKTTLQADPTL